MGITPQQRAAALALLDDEDTDPADLVAAMGAAMTDVVEAVGDAIDEAEQTEPVIVVEQPAPPAPTELAAAEVAVIAAQSDATIAEMEAAASIDEAREERYHEHEIERVKAQNEMAPDPFEILDEVLGPVTEPEADERPVSLHKWFRPFGGGKR